MENFFGFVVEIGVGILKLSFEFIGWELGMLLNVYVFLFLFSDL